MAQFRSFNSDVPDPSYEVKVTAIMPAAAVTASTAGQPPRAMPVKVDSRINVEIKITNATMTNIDALMTGIRAEVTTKANMLIQIPETEDVPGFS